MNVRIYCEEAIWEFTIKYAIQNKDSGYCKYYSYQCYFSVFFYLFLSPEGLLFVFIYYRLAFL